MLSSSTLRLRQYTNAPDMKFATLILPACLYLSMHAEASLNQENRRFLGLRRPGSTTTEKYGSYGSSTGASSSSSIYGTPSYSSGSSSYSGYDSQPSTSQYGNYGKTSHWGSSSNGQHGDQLHVPIAWVILINLSIFFISTLITAHQFEHYPEGNFANFCRLCINAMDCIFKLVYNLYHCRLNEIPSVVSAEDADDEYTEQELQNMKLRPGISKALEVEHHKSMRKTALQIKAMKAAKTKQKTTKLSNSSPKTSALR